MARNQEFRFIFLFSVLSRVYTSPYMGRLVSKSALRSRKRQLIGMS